MKAYVLKDKADLRYVDVDTPKISSEWALVKVKACGICSSDIPRIFTKGTYHFPTIPGHEFSGEVVAVGDSIYEKWINKRVAVFPLIPCNKCESCKKKQYEMCENYNYLGSRCDGGFAEYVAVPIWNLIELDESISFCEGAMFEPFAVALHCLNQAKLKGGQSVAIIGSGAIAFGAGQWAKCFGAIKVCVVGRSERKRDIAKSLGIEYITINNIKEEKYDIVIEAVGTSNSLETAIGLAVNGGKVVAMGNPSGNINLSQSIYWQILRKQLNLVGTWNSSYDGINHSEWISVRTAFLNKRINAEALITHKFSQKELYKGLEIMKDKSEMFCKVMTIWNEEL